MPEKLRVVVNDKAFVVEVQEREPHRLRFTVNGRSYQVRLEREVLQEAQSEAAAEKSQPTQKRISAVAQSDEATAVRAPIPGLVAAVLVEVGEHVEAGQSLLRLEAMKMQNSITAPAAGQVVAIHISLGEEVADGAVLLEIATGNS